MGDVLEDELFTAKGMKRHTEFSARNDRCIELLDQLEQELTEAVFYHVTSVDCAWQERIHFFAVEDYYIGYRTAVEILEHVRPNATGYMVPDTLLIEYELGKLERNDRLEELARREREAKREWLIRRCSKKFPLTCEVMAKTKADLEEFSETSSISVGEIIDNLVSKLSSTDPTLAAQVILESTAIAISPMDDTDTFETIVPGSPGSIRAYFQSGPF